MRLGSEDATDKGPIHPSPLTCPAENRRRIKRYGAFRTWQSSAATAADAFAVDAIHRPHDVRASTALARGRGGLPRQCARMVRLRHLRLFCRDHRAAVLSVEERS